MRLVRADLRPHPAHGEILLHPVQGPPSSPTQAPRSGDEVNEREVGELRYRYGLSGAPKRDKRERILVAMNDLFVHGRTESEVREVVSTSASSWQRARTWYREERGLAVNEPLVAGPLDRGMSDITSWDRWHALARDAAAERDARPVRQLSSGQGWSFIGGMIRAGQRAQLENTYGADLDDPIANMHYLRWRERREAARAQRRKDMADA